VNLPGADLNPRWSPDGKSILFVSTSDDPENRGTGVYVVDTETAKLTFVSDFAAWPGIQRAPDGRRILVGASKSSMLLVSADGKTRTPLADIGLDPVFSPDGGELQYRMLPPDGSIWAIRVGDLVRRKVVDGGGTFCPWPVKK
jgi:Tol biopolymer transport system component